MRKTAIGTYAMVPIAILHDQNVTLKMLRVYIAISSFQGSNENCWPSREGIAERSGMKSLPDVSSAITALVNAGWITRVRRPQKHKTNIYKVRFVAEDVDIIEGSGNADIQKSECMRNDHPESLRSTDIPLYEKNIEKNKGEKEDIQPKIEDVISFLNLKSGKNFRSQSKATKRLISARLKEGYAPDDLKRVIEFKAKEWKGTDFEKFLRPETLFNATKFEGYINNVPREVTYKAMPGIELPEHFYD